MRDVKIQQTKEKAFAAAIEKLVLYMRAMQRLDVDDEELRRRIDAVLKMMFFEDDPTAKALYKKQWDGFMTRVLKMRQEDLLVLLLLIQKTLRAGRKRYGTNIDFYFSPEVYKLSLKPRGWFEWRPQKKFLKQVLQNYKAPTAYPQSIVVQQQEPFKPAKPAKPAKPVKKQQQLPVRQQKLEQQLLVATPIGKQPQKKQEKRSLLLASIGKGVALKPVKKQQQLPAMQHELEQPPVATPIGKQLQKKQDKKSLLLASIGKGVALKPVATQQKKQQPQAKTNSGATRGATLAQMLKEGKQKLTKPKSRPQTSRQPTMAEEMAAKLKKRYKATHGQDSDSDSDFDD